MSESDEVVQRLMLLVLRAYEKITALEFALEAKGLLKPAEKETAMAKAEERWRRDRERLEGPGPADSDLLERLLRDFEGPLQ